MRLLIITVLISLIAISTAAEFPEKNVQFDKLDMSQGLSNNWIICFHKDSRGFLWIGTWDGLNKYDGNSFTNYIPNEVDSNSISGNMINAIYEDKNNNLWIATNANYVSIYNRETETFSRFDPSGDSIDRRIETAYCFFELNDSTLLIGTEHGLDVFSLSKKTIKRLYHIENQSNSIAGNIIRDITKTRKNEVFVATNNGLSKMDVNDLTFMNYKHSKDNPYSLAHNYVNALHLDGRGQLWVGTNAGLSRYQPVSNSFRNYLVPNKDQKVLDPASYIRDIADNGQDEIYISTDNGLAILRNENVTYYLPDFGNNNSLSSNNLTSLLYDSYGTLWIGTYNGGINYTNKLKNRFLHIKAERDRLQNPYVYSITQDQLGRIWVGTEQGLNIIDFERNAFNEFKPHFRSNLLLKDKAILSLLCDSYGDIWVGTHNAGLFLLKKGSSEFINYEKNNSSSGLSDNYIFRIFENQEKEILIATQKEIQYYNRQSGKFTSLSERLGKAVNSGFVYNIYEEPSGNLWLSTNFGIRYIDFINDTVLYIRRDDDKINHLGSNKTSCISGDSKGNIWIGLGGEGLNHLNTTTGEFTLYTTANGLPHNNISNILEDKQGNIWLSCGRGIAKFENGINTPRNPEFKIYEPGEIEEWYGFKESSLFVAKDGVVYIGSHNGLFAFNPEDIIDNPYPPDLVLTNLAIYNQKIPVTSNGVLRKQLNETSQINLTYKQSVFTIEFAALNFIYPRKNYYAYKLEGVSEWIDIGSDRSITFSNLKPGKYSLLIKAANNHKIWNQQPRKLQITIRPAWYNTQIFRLLVIFLLTSLIFTLVRIRILGLRKKQILLGKLVEQRTKEINAQKDILKEQAIQLKEQTLNLEATNQDLQEKNIEVIAQKEHIMEMSDKLHEADQLRLRFLTNISHELLTPLTIITSSLETLIQSNPSELVRNTCVNMLKNGNKLLHLIRQLLEFRQIDNGVLKLHAEEHDIIQFIHEIKQAFDPIAERSNIIFSFSTGVKSLKTWFDPDKIEKILYNLLSNAFRYTSKEGSVSIVIENGPSMTIPDTDLETRSLYIKVADTGIGIIPEHVHKIFDRFFKSEEGRELHMKGSGIGLSFAQELAQLHKSILTVTSEFGKGSTFCLQMPIGKGYLHSSERIPTIRIAIPDFVKTMVDIDLTEEHTKPDSVRPESAPIILIIEDNKSIRSLIASELQDSYYVFEASDGLEGFVKAKEQLPDLIISDIMMPKIDGIELCIKLKSEILTSHIPVLLLTAKGDDENKIAGYQGGADDYITKPFSIAVLRARIENIIKSRRQLKDKYFNSIEQDPATMFPENTIDRRFLEKIIAIVENDLSNPDLDNKQLMKEVGIGKSQLYAKIKSLTGQSVHEFMRTVRLKKAAELLINNPTSISEVAFMTGFNSLIYFSRSFKKQFNITPTEYIAMHKQE